MKHSLKVKIKEKMTNKEKNRIQKTTRFSGWTWQQYKKERKTKANCELSSILLWCFSFSFFTWWPQEQKGSLRRITLTLHRTGLFSKWICGSFSLTKLWYQLKSHFLILHDQADNCQLMNYLYLYSNLARKSFSSGNTDGLIQTFC